MLPSKSQENIYPLSVVVITSEGFEGLNLTLRTSDECSNVSKIPFFPKISQIFTVLSHELVARYPLLELLKEILEIGAVWPAKTSSNYPVFKLHKYTLYGSFEPAQTTSPD